MKKNLAVMAGLIAGSTLLMATGPAMAAHVDVGVNIGLPGVYVQPAPVYVQERPAYVRPEYEQDWHERHARAREWRDHQRHDDRHDDHHDRGEHRGHDD
jgi:hypothetical protein